MTSWNRRQMPYPLLAPWSDDYKENARFSAIAPEAVLTSDGRIDLHIQYRLTANVLNSLIEEGKAVYTCLVTCPNTLTRETYTTRYPDQYLTLEAKNFARNIFFTPHVCATAVIERFKSKDHSNEYLTLKPQGFTIPSASILAIGDTTAISLNDSTAAYSIIDLVPDDKTPPGTFDLDLEQDRIKIHVAPVDKAIIDSQRKMGAYTNEFIALSSGIFMHAISEAIRQIDDHKNREWNDAIRWALERHNIQGEARELKQHALRHAQTIMGNPIGRLLTTFSKHDEED